MKRTALVLSLLAAVALTIAAQSSASSPLASTPPLGWNSYDAYGISITESQFKANTDWFHQHLQKYGWEYVAIDANWYYAHPLDPHNYGFTMSADGRYLPALNRFPSAANNQGFKPLADYVHSLGLKFGIHILRGIPREAADKNLPIAGSSLHAADAADTSDRCRWNADNYGIKSNPAGQAYYDSILRLYARWGIDFLKVDCISSPYKSDEIRMIAAAIRKSGRPIVLSLSPGPTPLAEASNVTQYAQLWRVSNDFWDLWASPHDENGFPQSLRNQFQLLAQWEPYAGPGHWPDGDMLPIGYLGPHAGWGPSPRPSRLNHTEARTLVTLWSIARSPLVIGANLTRMDAATESLLTNPEVLAVDQHTTENHQIETAENSNIVMWAARLGSDHIIAVFNRGNAPARVNTPPWQKLGSQFGLDLSRYRVRDLWLRKDLGPRSSLSVTLPPHGSALFRLSR
ncbi:MAG TPA: glycoside hydrolase family 27 protein [Silvibacterium sp.]|nr:glycoside hydrolase family 27 protein [Silvibacterium sp.]